MFSNTKLDELISVVKALTAQLVVSEGKGICPVLRSPCIEHRCRWYTNIIGMHPQTGETVNQWECAVPHIVLTNIEGAQQTRQAGAAIESFRNEMVRSNEKSQALMTQQLQQSHLLEHDHAE